MSSKQRGTKRAADSAPSGPKFKSAKSAPTFNKGGKDSKPFNKDAKPFNKDSKPFNKKGNDWRGSKGKAPAKAWDKPKPAAREVEAPAARRKRPVTQGGGDEEVDDDAMSVDGGEDEEAGEGEAAPVEEEKRGKMSKEERAAMHAANPHRKTLLPSHVLLTETLLPLWEEARRLEMPKEERVKAITELWAAVQGHALEISRGHKGGRILQTVSKPFLFLQQKSNPRSSSTAARRSATASRWSSSQNGGR